MKEATVVFGVALRFIRCTLVVAIMLVIGCGKDGNQIKCDKSMGSVPEDVSFRNAVAALTDGLSGNENRFRQSAYRLCSKMTQKQRQEIREMTKCLLGELPSEMLKDK